MSQVKSKFAEIPTYYDTKDVCRIVNIKQHMLYMKHGLFPVDMYYSKGLLVYVYDKAESEECYKKWCERTLE